MSDCVPPLYKGVVGTMLASLLRKCDAFQGELEGALDLPYDFIEHQIDDIIVHSFVEYQKDGVVLCDFNVEVRFFDYSPELFKVTLL